MDRLPSLSPQEPPAPVPEPRRRSNRWLGALVVPALVGGGIAYAVADRVSGDGTTTTVTVVQTTAGTATTPVPRSSGGAGPDIPAIVRNTRAGVVLVTVRSGLGTGFLIDRKGHILTNAHVVDDATSVNVQYADGTIQNARVLASDQSIDLAVLDTGEPPAGAKVVPLGTSKTLQVGETVVAIGNPMGQDSSVTLGIVSATKRTICSPNRNFIPNAIQTDAAINPGNSGGPLLNTDGQVVGINSQILSQGGGNEGIGFAVPMDLIKPVAEGVIAGGKPKHAWIGIEGEPVTPQLAKQLGLTVTGGVAVRVVNPNGPAKTAGMIGSPARDSEPPKGGDVIVAVNSAPVADFGDLSQEISSRTVGDRVVITVLRGGKKTDLQVTLADRPTSIGGTCDQ